MYNDALDRDLNIYPSIWSKVDRYVRKTNNIRS